MSGIAEKTAPAPVEPSRNGASPDAAPWQPPDGYRTGQNETDFALSAKQVRALPYMLSTPKVTEAAAAVGVSRTTIYRWLEDPSFAAELNRCREDATEEALRALKGMLIQSVEAVAGLLQSENERVRLGAARLALTYGFRVMEDQDIVRRLAMLENTVHLWKERNPRAY